jgi:hypothetical protein
MPLFTQILPILLVSFKILTQFLGVLAVVMPGQFSREQVFALIAFGILFSLVIPSLLK